MQYGHHGITYNDILTWQVQFAKEGCLPPEAQRRLLESAARHDFHSHSGPTIVPHGIMK